MHRIRNILAVGDCITLGVKDCLGNSYPERIGKKLCCSVTNNGYTMSTSREGVHLLADNLKTKHDCVILQFGVADSHITFKYAPYILYYPDGSMRKLVRNIVKKYKKLTKRFGINKRFGEARVVSEHEYQTNYLRMIERCGDRLIILPETVPQQETFRNPGIRRYNEILEEIAVSQDRCLFVRLFEDFTANMTTFYLDNAHPNGDGYDHIAAKILRSLN